MKIYRVLLLTGEIRDMNKAQMRFAVEHKLGKIIEIIYDLSTEVPTAIAVNA